jgi:hypothetical protein
MLRTFTIMDHVFRDCSVREHISRQATSAVEARAEQVYGQWKEIQGLSICQPSPLKPNVEVEPAAPRSYVLDVSFR